MIAYVYKLTCDDGGAPCVMDGLLSLAICKPMIRSSAQTGSWIFGFAANGLSKTHPGNRLIYVARVDERVPAARYYSDKSIYRTRPDCIYKPVHGGYRWRRGSTYHLEGSSKDHDLGTSANNFARAWVLVSNCFRYFGADGYTILPTTAPMSELMNRLGQGHRCNLDHATLEELHELKNRAFMQKGLLASPVVRDSVPGCFGVCEQGLASNDQCCG